jgi:hypothetical protein
MVFEFGRFNLTAAQQWFEAAKTGADIITREQRNSAAVIMGGLMDALAAPDRVLGVGAAPMRLPEVPYGGSDRQFVGRNVALVGAMPVPEHWRTGAAAPESLPAWLRASDADRRSLYGALASVLEDLGRSGDSNPQQGTQRNSGFIQALPVGVVALGVVAVAGVAAWAFHEAGDTAREFVRERAEVQRAAESAATAVKLYLERLRVLRDTGSMPAASPAEVAIQPRAANGAPAPGSPSARGNDWWARAKDAAPMALGGLAAAGAVALGVAWVIGQKKKAARMAAGFSGSAPTAPSQERAVW